VTASDLLARIQMLLCHGDLIVAEPKRLRYRLLSRARQDRPQAEQRTGRRRPSACPRPKDIDANQRSCRRHVH
jgi:hypothetical protein